MSKSKFQILVLISVAIILTIIAVILINRRYQTVIVDIPKFEHQAPAPLVKHNDKTQNDGIISKSKIINPKTSILLPVPFTPQAPTGNWDILHNEACEEADAYMAGAYFKFPEAQLPAPGTLIAPEDFEKALAILTKWQDEHFGYHLDTTSAETAQMIEGYFALRTRMIENFTANDIKKELSAGNLVVISENGRKLGNPFYKQPGPIHHMLLIKGYDTNGNFITNDSGTKRGLNYFYTFGVLYSAAADWNHEKNTVDQNKKIAIVVGNWP